MVPGLELGPEEDLRVKGLGLREVIVCQDEPDVAAGPRSQASRRARRVVAELGNHLQDRIARLELARVEKKNALTADMYRALADGLALADGDARVRAVLLHGRPDCFCAGNDLEDFLERDVTRESPALDFLRRIAESRKPIVAAVGGPAVGIGVTNLLFTFVGLWLIDRAGRRTLLYVGSVGYEFRFTEVVPAV